MTADEAIEAIEEIDDIEEDMVAVDVEVIEEIVFLDGNSSIQETKKLVGVVAVVAEPRDSMSYNFALMVEKGSTKNKVKGIGYLYFAYYSNYSYYSKMEMSLGSYLGFEASKASFVQ